MTKIKNGTSEAKITSEAKVTELKINALKSIESDKIAKLQSDILNKAKTLNKSKVTSYNYLKIAKNLAFLNKTFSLNLSDEDILDIQKNVSLFVNEKTKTGFATNILYSKIKKNVRNNVRNLKSVNSTFTETEKEYIRSLVM